MSQREHACQTRQGRGECHSRGPTTAPRPPAARAPVRVAPDQAGSQPYTLWREEIGKREDRGPTREHCLESKAGHSGEPRKRGGNTQARKHAATACPPSVRTIATGERVSQREHAGQIPVGRGECRRPTTRVSAGSRLNLSKRLIYSGGGGENSVAIARAPLLRPGRGRGNPRG